MIILVDSAPLTSETLAQLHVALGSGQPVVVYPAGHRLYPGAVAGILHISYLEALALLGDRREAAIEEVLEYRDHHSGPLLEAEINIHVDAFREQLGD